MNIVKKVSPHFEDFIFDWDYEQYLLLGSYGSGKSYHIALKIILKLFEEKRKCLVVREVFETIKDSCYDLFCEILDEMGLLTHDTQVFRKSKNKTLALKSPLSLTFQNGSQIIFKGMDKPEKVKSINGVSIVWFEECSEIKFEGYKEVLGRVRTPDLSMHFILSCNPVSRENWVYRYFFVDINEHGKERIIVDEEYFYKKQILIKNGTYYHHSTADNNNWLPRRYIQRLNKIKTYDPHLYLVARWGRFGATGTRVLPQIRVVSQEKKRFFLQEVKRLGGENMYFGFDFGFEDSYNAVISCSVDNEKGYLFIWDEIYMNGVTDNIFAELPEMQYLKKRVEDLNNAGINKMIIADNADPKAISYYRQVGFRIRGCRNKFVGSRLSNTRKIKRFKKIYISPKCVNTIRELKDLTYAKDRKGDTIFDKFNIDPHTFSALWYALDTVTVANLKDKEYYSKIG